MKTFTAAATALAGAALFLKSAYAEDLPSIVISGSKFFFESNGTQFYMKGIAYQEDYSGNGTETSSESTSDYIDPLSDVSKCERDVPYLQQLGTNTIRVYAIDPTLNHDDCIQLLQDAGIYVIYDLSSPSESIIRSDPSWDLELYERYTSVVDATANYTNTLGYFAGNEVSNNSTNTDASAFVKAAVRDMKSYISAQGYRTIGVGYATNDDAEIRDNLADYFDCGEDDEAIDFWGYNIYSWCGNSSFSESGYEARTEEFQDYNVPVFFAEYGCNEVQPREFTEVEALYGDDMNGVWSGGIVYMYFQEDNDYGLVTIDGDTASTMDDFPYLATQIANNANPTGTNSASYTPTNTAARTCPEVGDDWRASSDLPPTPNSELCECMYASVSCVPSSDLDDEALGELFGLVCGMGDDICEGIQANGTSGVYGAYSMCDTTQQVAWALNVYYEQQQEAGNGDEACDFDGAATSQDAEDLSDTCEDLINQAGEDGLGTVTSQPTATAGSGSGSGSGSTGSSSSSSSAGIPGFSTPKYFGFLQVAFCLSVALVSGAGMILL